MTTPKVKVCGITSAADAEMALALGVDWIGINGYGPSPRCVDLATARDLCNRIPAGKRVLVDVNTGAQELERFGDLGFDAFQIHCDYETGLVDVAVWAGIVGADALWLAPKWPPMKPFPQTILEFCETVVVDAYRRDQYGGTGSTADWPRFAEVQTLYPHKRFVLAGGLGPDNIAEAVAASGAAFVDVNSGVESSPGVKDASKLRALLQAIGR